MRDTGQGTQVDYSLLEEFVVYRQDAYSAFALPESHDCTRTYLSICRSATLGYDVPDGKETPLKHFHVREMERRKGKTVTDDSADFIALDNYGILVAWAGLHILFNHQKTILEHKFRHYHVDFSSKLSRMMSDYCIICSLGAYYSDRCSKGTKAEIKDAFRYVSERGSLKDMRVEPHGYIAEKQRLESRGFYNILHHAQRYSLDQTKLADRRYRCRALYMGALFDTNPSRTFNRNTLYFGYLQVDNVNGFLFAVDGESGCMDLSPMFSVTSHGESSVVDRSLLKGYVWFMLRSVPQNTTVVNVNVHDFDVFDTVPQTVYHWTGDWHDQKKAAGSPNPALPYIPAIAIYKLVQVMFHPHRFMDHDFWTSFDGTSLGSNWPGTVVENYHLTQWHTKSGERRFSRLGVGEDDVSRIRIVDASSLRQKPCEAFRGVQNAYLGVSLRTEADPTKFKESFSSSECKFVQDAITEDTTSCRFNLQLMEPTLVSDIDHDNAKSAAKIDEGYCNEKHDKLLLFLFLLHYCDGMKNLETFAQKERIFDLYWKAFTNSSTDNELDTTDEKDESDEPSPEIQGNPEVNSKQKAYEQSSDEEERIEQPLQLINQQNNRITEPSTPQSSTSVIHPPNQNTQTPSPNTSSHDNNQTNPPKRKRRSPPKDIKTLNEIPLPPKRKRGRSRKYS